MLNPDGSRPAPPETGLGYSNQSVATVRGSFNVHLIKERLSAVTVKTLTANATTCLSNCPAKPLDQYVSENAAYAGMNGTYLCPPDYAQCAGKVNSYDYAVYNSNLRSWINYNALNAQNGGIFFNGASTSVYRRTYVYFQNQTPVNAAITNFPLLVQNGGVIEWHKGSDRGRRDLHLPRHRDQRHGHGCRLRDAGPRRARRAQPGRRRDRRDVDRRLIQGRPRPVAPERDRPHQALIFEGEAGAGASVREAPFNPSSDAALAASPA